MGLEETRYLATIVAGIPHVAKAMEDVPVEQLWRALEAAEVSYWRTLRQSGFAESKCQTWTSAIMRRLKGQVAADGLTQVEMLKRLREEVGRAPG
jgi:hypothetical protein